MTTVLSIPVGRMAFGVISVVILLLLAFAFICVMLYAFKNALGPPAADEIEKIIFAVVPDDPSVKSVEDWVDVEKKEKMELCYEE